MELVTNEPLYLRNNFSRLKAIPRTASLPRGLTAEKPQAEGETTLPALELNDLVLPTQTKRLIRQSVFQ